MNTLYVKYPTNAQEGELLASNNEILVRVYEEPIFQTTLVIMFCDIYLNGTYYKTVSKTTYETEAVWVPTYSTYAPGPVWSFDISSVVGEFFKNNYPPDWGVLSDASQATVQVVCKFRGGEYVYSVLDVKPLPAPIQATKFTPAQNGGGVATVPMIVQHAAANHNDTRSLKDRISGTFVGFGDLFMWPLSAVKTNSPVVNIPLPVCRGAIFTTPFMLPYNAVEGGITNTASPIGLKLYVTYKNGTSAFVTLNSPTITGFADRSTYNIQAGLEKLKTYTWSAVVQWDDIVSYKLRIVYNGEEEAESVTYMPFNCCEGTTHLIFLNKFGAYESIFFTQKEVASKVASSRWKKKERYFNISEIDQKRSYGAARANVRSNDFYKLSTNIYGEEHNEWLSHFFESPRVYMVFPNNYLVPMILSDADHTKLKIDGRYEYRTEAVLEWSNENNTMYV